MSYWNPKSREMTNKILRAIEEGLLDRDHVILSCLLYLSEDQVKDMADANEFFLDEDEEEEEEEDEEWTPDNADFNDVGLRHHY